jgi:hypothetical protein
MLYYPTMAGAKQLVRRAMKNRRIRDWIELWGIARLMKKKGRD